MEDAFTTSVVEFVEKCIPKCVAAEDRVEFEVEVLVEIHFSSANERNGVATEFHPIEIDFVTLDVEFHISLVKSVIVFEVENRE